MRFWGWGSDDEAGDGLPPHADALLRGELGLPEASVPQRVRRIADVRVGESALGDDARAALAAVCEVRDDQP
jgi:hypothetical protein